MTMKRAAAVGAVLLLCAQALALDAPPKREFRGAWIATVHNLDWPSSRGLTPEAQRRELVDWLDELSGCGINCVVLQIRPECDALYPSPYEPWSYHLTGTQGVAPVPLYDPLAFAVQEAHRRGMELHAWFNPYRAVSNTGAYSLSPQHVSQRHPEWIITIGSIQFLNPGLPQVREYVVRVVMDVVRRYDIDGIHFDDYFYPYPPNQITTEDQNAFALYGQASPDIHTWRRANVHAFVQMMHDSLQMVKPQVKFGISPFGIWKNGVPSGIAGLSAYDAIYCDAVTWLQHQWIDYLTPQLYWKIGGAQDYSRLMRWWSARMNGRHLYTGNAVYRISEWSSREMPNQLRLNRSGSPAWGQIFYRATSLRENPLGFTDSLKSNFYRFPSLLPVMTWKDSLPPPPPEQLRFQPLASGGPVFSWDPPLPAGDGDTAARYALYRIHRTEVTPADLQPVSLLTVTGGRSLDPTPAAEAGQYSFVVTALDRSGNESGCSNVLQLAAPAAPQLVQPLDKTFDLGLAVRLSWRRNAAASRYRLQMTTDSTFARVLLNQLLTDTTRALQNLSPNLTYYWRVQAQNPAGAGDYSPVWAFRRAPVSSSVEQNPSPPQQFRLEQNYPNPFNAQTVISFELPRNGWVRLEVYDVMGRRVSVLMDRSLPAGAHSCLWTPRSLASGVYLYRMTFEETVLVRRLLLLK